MTLSMWLPGKRPSFDTQLTRTCITCQNTFSGRFCNACGEKVIEPYDRSVKNFIGSLVNAFTFIDNKFIRSFKCMVLHPGRMASHIAMGKRKPYMKPIAFFFVANFIYFLFPLFQTFNTNIHAQMNLMPYSSYVRDKVHTFIEQKDIEFNEFAETYNSASTNISKLILISLALLIFPFVILINYSKKYFLSDHFLFSLDFSSYLLFIPSIVFPFILLLIVKLLALFDVDANFLFEDRYTLPFILALIIYFFIRGLHIFYQRPRWRTALNAVLLTLALIPVINAYRFVLFSLTMRWI